MLSRTLFIICLLHLLIIVDADLRVANITTRAPSQDGGSKANTSADANTLKQRCYELDPSLRWAWVEGACFVVTATPTTEGYNTWRNMRKHCNHFKGYSGRMATISSKKELEQLFHQKIMGEKDMMLYIGALQDPSDAFTCGASGHCPPEIHSKNWWFIDEDGNKLSELNPALWSKEQPTNPDGKDENAVAIVRTRGGLELHDYHPVRSSAKVLCQYQDVTTLKHKCEKLSSSLKKAWIGNSCFVISKNISQEGYNTWRNMRKYCSHIPGVRGRMATINTQQQMDELVRLKMLEEELFVGAIQDPSDAGSCGADNCGAEKHRENWWFIDENGKRLNEVNPKLWLSANGEPNNNNEHLPENAATLSFVESGDKIQPGLNDVNGFLHQHKVLCQYGEN